MQHVILARDRRKKKNRIRVFLLILAIFSVFIGIVLSFKEQASLKAPEQDKIVVLDDLDEGQKDDH